EWDEPRHQALQTELAEAVRAAVKEGEAVGCLGKSKPSVREMFEGVFKDPDWRLIEQRRELGI
ncbi:MAG TPA: 3-methyl-2-oxobutanoate dehydrogenase (2-methylpropanoyl-transferring) subunit alpha, partial [Phenylobacterium sp.]